MHKGPSFGGMNMSDRLAFDPQPLWKITFLNGQLSIAMWTFERAYVYYVLLCITIMYDWYIISSGIYLGHNICNIYIYICQCNTYSHPRSVRSVNSFYHNSKTPSYRGPRQVSRKGNKGRTHWASKKGLGVRWRRKLTQNLLCKNALAKSVESLQRSLIC